ncbi:MAG: cysteine desulfurase family protein, partial [Candidatus Taylorbacteria bacterium]
VYNIHTMKSATRIYLDYASLTPIDPRVLRTMKEYSSTKYANPSSWYREGVAAKKALDEARKTVADFIGAHADEIFFTSGGTESNNIALQGVVSAAIAKGIKAHIIISAIEHSSIMETARMLESRGCEVTKIPVNERGVLDLDELKKAIKPHTVLVSIMTVNNELGTIQPIRDIAKVIRQVRAKFSSTKSGRSDFPIFHTDAAQAGLFQNLNVEQLGVDLITLDAGKLYGPRGIGALYVRRNLLRGDKPLINPIVFGGGQENGLRSGTENLPAIMGFAKALEIAQKERSKESLQIEKLRQSFIVGLKKIRSDITVNSGIGDTSPYILNVSIPGIDNEFFVMQLDAAGISCSTKSSCLRDEDESYVLKAIGADSKTSVRFSFGRWTKMGDIVKALRVISASVIISPTC